MCLNAVIINKYITGLYHICSTYALLSIKVKKADIKINLLEIILDIGLSVSYTPCTLGM